MRARTMVAPGEVEEVDHGVGDDAAEGAFDRESAAPEEMPGKEGDGGGGGR